MPRRPLLALAGDRRPYARLERLDYAASLPAFLTRLGFSGWEVVRLEDLDAAVLRDRALVVVPFAPAASWPEWAIDALAAFDGPSLLEGPLPAAAARRLLGVEARGEEEQFIGRIGWAGRPVADDPLHARLDRLSRLENRPHLSPREERVVYRRIPRSARQPTHTPGWELALAHLRNAAEKAATPRSFYRHPRVVLQGITLLLHGIVLAGDPEAPTPWPPDWLSWSHDRSLALLHGLGEAMADGRRPIDPAWGAGLLTAAEVEPPPADALDVAALEPLLLEMMEFLVVARTLAARARNGDLARCDELIGNVGQLLGLPALREPVRQPAHRLAAIRLWARLAGASIEVVEPEEVSLPRSPAEAEHLKAQAIVAAADSPLAHAVIESARSLRAQLEETTDGVAAATVALTAHAARLAGAGDVATDLVRAAAEAMRDEVSGLLADTAIRISPDIGLALLGAQLGAPPPETAPAGRLSRRMLARWRRGVGPLQRWRPIAGDTEVILTAGAEEAIASWPLLVRRGNRLGTSHPLLTWAVAECCPAPPPSHSRMHDVVPAIETYQAVIGLLEHLWISARQPRLLVWPWPATFGATLRHDVDRVPPRQTLEPILAGEASHRLASTYCFIAGRFATPMRDLLLRLGHEITVHGGDFEEIPQDVEAISAWAGAPVAGWTAHGTPNGKSSQGAAVWQAAEAVGLSYADVSMLLSSGFPTPAVVPVDGGRSTARLELDVFDIDFGLDGHLAGSALSRDGEVEVELELERCRCHRDHFCLNNHPDLAGAAHAEVVGRIVARTGEDAWWATLAHVARRRREVQAVELTHEDDGTIALRAPQDMRGLQLVLAGHGDAVPVVLRGGRPAARLVPGRSLELFALDLPGSRTVTIGWAPARTAEALPLCSVTRSEPGHADVEPAEIGRAIARDGIRRAAETAFPVLRDRLALAVEDAVAAGRMGGGQGSEAVLDERVMAPSRRAALVRRGIERAYRVDVEGANVLQLRGGLGAFGLWLLCEAGAGTLTVHSADEVERSLLESVCGEVGLIEVETCNLLPALHRTEAGRYDIAAVGGIGPIPDPELDGLLAIARNALRPGGLVVVDAASRWVTAEEGREIAALSLLPRPQRLRALEFLAGSPIPAREPSAIPPTWLIERLRRSGLGSLRLIPQPPAWRVHALTRSPRLLLTGRTPDA